MVNVSMVCISLVALVSVADTVMSDDPDKDMPGPAVNA